MSELILVIGPCGAGKTTYARAHYPDHLHVGTDPLICAMRADMRLKWYPHLHAASRRMQDAALDYLLSHGHNVCVTDGGTTRRRRQKWSALAHRYGATLSIVRLLVAPDVCIMRAQADPDRPKTSKSGWPKIVAHWFRDFEPVDMEHEDIDLYQEIDNA